MKCSLCKYKGPQKVGLLPDLRYIINGLPWNKTICYNQFNKFTPPVSNHFEQNWKIFLDNGFTFLRLSLIKANKLLNVLNNISPVIQFTTEASDTQLPFLDIMINKERKKIFMDIYWKPTDSISPSNQKTPNIAWKTYHFLFLPEFGWLLKKTL